MPCPSSPHSSLSSSVTGTKKGSTCTVRSLLSSLGGLCTAMPHQQHGLRRLRSMHAAGASRKKLPSRLQRRTLAISAAGLHHTAGATTGCSRSCWQAGRMKQAQRTCRRSQWESMSDAEAAPEDLRRMSSTKPKLACGSKQTFEAHCHMAAAARPGSCTQECLAPPCRWWQTCSTKHTACRPVTPAGSAHKQQASDLACIPQGLAGTKA